MGQCGCILSGGLRQCAGHQPLTDPDPKATSDQFVKQKTLLHRQLIPCADDLWLALIGRQRV